jgi:TonB family protein
MKTFAKVVGTWAMALTQAIGQTPGPSAASASPESKADPVEASNQCVALGDPIQTVAPKYPKRALKEHVQGDVVLKLSVSAKGKVRDISPISGDPELTEAASHAVRHWEFVPYFENERPTDVLTKVTIVFKIDDTGHPQITAMSDPPRPPPDNQVLKVGGGVTPPKLLYGPDAQWTEPVQGVVELSAIVLPNGTTSSVQVTKSLRPDLDAKAVEAVGHWRFRPATKDGKAVAVLFRVEVSFRVF